mgnify:CR=1 FL=1
MKRGNKKEIPLIVIIIVIILVVLVIGIGIYFSIKTTIKMGPHTAADIPFPTFLEGNRCTEDTYFEDCWNSSGFGAPPIFICDPTNKKVMQPLYDCKYRCILNQFCAKRCTKEWGFASKVKILI